MKTAEITRHKQAAAGIKPPSTWAVFADIYRREGLAGINKGVNAVAVRQCTNWGSRMGFARLAESSIRKMKGKGEGEKGSQCTMNFIGHKDYVLSVAVSHDGKWVVSGSKDRGVQFWDANTAVAQCMLQGHKNSGE